MSNDNGDTQELELELEEATQVISDIQAYVDYVGIQSFNDKGLRSQVVYLVINYLSETNAQIATCAKCGNEYQQPDNGNRLCISCYMEAREKITA